ncbi:MAG: class I SAM-dependent methyltransferase [Thermoanaerobaculia bacterium]
MHRFFEAVVAPALQALRPKVIVEIGALAGAMTNKLVDYGIEHGAVVHSIDPEPQFERREVASFVFHRALSHDALPEISRVDLALIDGDHNYYTVRGELQILAANAKRDSHPFPVVMLHDVGWPYGRRDSYWDPSTVPVEYQQLSSRKGMRPGQSELVEDGGGLNSQSINANHEGGARNGVLTAVEDFVSSVPRELTYVHLPVLHGFGILCPASHRRDLAPVIESLELSAALESVITSTEADRLHHQIKAEQLHSQIKSQ